MFKLPLCRLSVTNITVLAVKSVFIRSGILNKISDESLNGKSGQFCKINLNNSFGTKFSCLTKKTTEFPFPVLWITVTIQLAIFQFHKTPFKGWRELAIYDIVLHKVIQIGT